MSIKLEVGSKAEGTSINNYAATYVAHNNPDTHFGTSGMGASSLFGGFWKFLGGGTPVFGDNYLGKNQFKADGTLFAKTKAGGDNFKMTGPIAISGAKHSIYGDLDQVILGKNGYVGEREDANPTDHFFTFKGLSDYVGNGKDAGGSVIQGRSYKSEKAGEKISTNDDVINGTVNNKITIDESSLPNWVFEKNQADLLDQAPTAVNKSTNLVHEVVYGLMNGDLGALKYLVKHSIGTDQEGVTKLWNHKWTANEVTHEYNLDHSQVTDASTGHGIFA